MREDDPAIAPLIESLAIGIRALAVGQHRFRPGSGSSIVAIEQERMATSNAKRHHYVPRSYLARFAEGGVVYVRWRDSRRYKANPTNVAVETGFYDVSDGGTGKSEVEDILAAVDDAAISALRSIDRSLRPPDPETTDRLDLAMFLGLQSTRTPELRERLLFPENLASYASGREISKELVRNYLAEVHLGFEPIAMEVQAALDFVTVALHDEHKLTPSDRVRVMFGAARRMATVMLDIAWTVEVDRKENFITSDTPIVIWRSPTPRDQYEGVGVLNAEEIRFPLDPGKQLVLSHRHRSPSVRVAPDRARSCNRDMADACHRFIAGRPGRGPAIDALRVSERRPVLRFHTGPLYAKQLDGSAKYEGELLHLWVPRR
jgi:hypothetical protein